MFRTLIRIAIAVVGLGIGDASADRFAIETYVGARPAEAESVMHVLRPILEARRFIARPAPLQELFVDRATRPGAADPRFDGEKWSANVEKGVNAFINASDDRDFDGVVTILEPLISNVRRNPVVLAREPKYREAMRRALIYYALARERQGRTATAHASAATNDIDRATLSKRASTAAEQRDATMAELIRSYPNRIIAAKDFGSEAEALFQRTRRELDKLGRARVEIDSGDADAVIYFNEMIEGRGKATIGDLVPGPCRVLIQTSTGDSIQYELQLIPNQTSRVSADLELDPVLVLSPWVGFNYANERQRAQEAELIVKLANGTGAIVAATFNVSQRNGHPLVIGTYYAARDGRLVRSALVEMRGHDDIEPLEELVKYLEGGPATDGVVPVQHPAHIPPPTPAPRDGSGTTEPDEAADIVPPSAKPPSPNALVPDRDHEHRYVLPGMVLGAGLVAVGAGVYLGHTSSRDSNSPGPKVYSQTALSLEIAGGGVIIVGFVLLHYAGHARKASKVAPSVSVTSSSAMLGWSGSF